MSKQKYKMHTLIRLPKSNTDCLFKYKQNDAYSNTYLKTMYVGAENVISCIIIIKIILLLIVKWYSNKQKHTLRNSRTV